MKQFLNHIELILSAAGVGVVLGAAFLAPETADVWQVAAVTALAVGVLHGIIFWTVRRRQRRIRAQSILEIREMLADVVKNQLAVIGMWLPTGSDRMLYEQQLDGIKESIQAISAQVDGLTEEAIQDWKGTYREAVANATEINDYARAA